MKTYRVSVYYEGCTDIEVEARNEEEAKAKAYSEFCDMDERVILSDISNIEPLDPVEEVEY